MTDITDMTGAGDSPASAAKPRPADDWRAELPDELRRAAERFRTPADAVKVAADLRRKLSNAVVLPGPKADAAEIAAFRRRLGVPESPGGYRLPDTGALPAPFASDPAVAATRQEFVAALHKAGATQDVVDAALGWYHESISDTHREGARALEEANREADCTLRREWGSAFERNVEFARRAYQSLVPEGLRERIEAIALDADADFKRLFARLGREIAEDDLVARGDSVGPTRSLEERAAELRARDDYWRNEDVQREMRTIMEQLHGTGPARTDTE